MRAETPREQFLRHKREWREQWNEDNGVKTRAYAPKKPRTLREQKKLYLDYRQISGRYHLGPWKRRVADPDYMGELERNLEVVFAERRNNGCTEAATNTRET